MTQRIHVPHLIKNVIWFDVINKTGLIQTQKTANADLIAGDMNAGIHKTLSVLLTDNPSITLLLPQHIADTFVPSLLYLFTFPVFCCPHTSIVKEDWLKMFIAFKMLCYMKIFVSMQCYQSIPYKNPSPAWLLLLFLKSQTGSFSSRQLHNQGLHSQSAGPLAFLLQVVRALDSCPWFITSVTKHHWLQCTDWGALCTGLASVTHRSWYTDPFFFPFWGCV